MERKNNNGKTKNIVLVGMFAAVLAVLSQIAIPMPSGLPVTLQTFAVALTGYVLGWKLGALATVAYVLLGAVGVPVFASLTGGLGILFGYSGGFLFGFIIMAFLCGHAGRQKNKLMAVLLSAAGLLACHLWGIFQFMLIMKMTFVESAVLASVPYIIKDVISAAAAFALGGVLKKSLYAANLIDHAKKA